MKIAISAESTADFTKELIDLYQIYVVPFSIQLGEETGFDGEITTDKIIEYVNKTGVLPKTSAVNEFQYNEHFEGLLKEHDAVIHFSLSSELSLACTNAKRSAQNFKNVFVVDSLSLSTGIALLVLYAKKLANNGLDAQAIYDKVVKRVPYVQASFELKRLDYLYKGGRCSGLTLFGANLLKIRPQILVQNGKMVPGKKYRGNFAHVVKNYCQDVLEEFDNPDLSEVFITYTTADNEVLEVAKNAVRERGFRNVHITRAGGTITSHCGEDCLGILYINDGGVNILF